MLMDSHELRRAFLDFFAQYGHTIVPSSSLVPGQDPSLLFTNAGMNQFKDAFLGLEQRPYSRATSMQRCLRVSGKHNDLEEVGPSPRHHTFFEMMGNFSFGDYFKEKAIAYAWEFFEGVLGLPRERLRPTVFAGDDEFAPDDEAARLWSEITGFPPERVARLGRKDNFWQMAEVGPAGPCSEIHYDQSGHCLRHADADCDPSCECGRWIELWNLVFMQFELRPDGSVVPLPKPSVDTGAGFERILSIMQGVATNYETDLFMPIMQRLQHMLGHSDEDRARLIAPYRAVADHSRAAVNVIADGVLPGNVGRNSILRRILRRAIYQGRLLGFAGPFLVEPARQAIAILGPAYPHLLEKQDFVLEVIADEAERFSHTLEAGLVRLETLLQDLPDQTLPGEEAFDLYATYGYPVDLTRLIAQQRGFEVDEPGFLAAQARHQATSRGEDLGSEALAAAEYYRDLQLPPTTFSGYETSRDTSPLRLLLCEGEAVRRASAGEQIEVVLERTPFYAESGGQVADTGFLVGEHGRFAVEQVFQPIPGLTVHAGRVEEGYLEQGETVRAEVDEERRADIARNHTATHLLHRALRRVLGEHVVQSGSLVAPDYLRFDFSHLRATKADELAEIERLVNASIRQNLPVVSRVLAKEQALQRGAIALFGEKYSETVRMISVEQDAEDYYTRELCGGTHVSRTGDIGAFFIRSESSIGAGLRRIEAVTGRPAVRWARQQRQQVEGLAELLGVAPKLLPERLQSLQEELKERERHIVDLERKLGQTQLSALLTQVQKIDGVPVLGARLDLPDVARLREVGDTLQNKLGQAILVLASVIDGQPRLVVMVGHELVSRGYHAGRILQQLSAILGGGGGGRPAMAQGGGGSPERLESALAKLADIVREQQAALS
ncbi:MAG: alanine--tRNA ligase [Chloroflexia bacterium]|nr:alanine--tRNA ligase [Chloroflexia bacterium]